MGAVALLLQALALAFVAWGQGRAFRLLAMWNASGVSSGVQPLSRRLPPKPRWKPLRRALEEADPVERVQSIRELELAVSLELMRSRLIARQSGRICAFSTVCALMLTWWGAREWGWIVLGLGGLGTLLGSSSARVLSVRLVRVRARWQATLGELDASSSRSISAREHGETPG